MEFVYIATAHFLALISPGPDFFLILQASLRLSRRAGLALCAGIAAANGLYLALAVAGVEVLRQVPGLLLAMRYLGALYLLWLGMLLLRAPRPDLDGGEGVGGNGDDRPGRQFTRGLLAALLNPKNAVFYLSLFTAMVSPDTGMMRRGLYGLWMTVVVFSWDGLLVLVLGNPLVRRRLQGTVYILEKGAGAMLAIAGLTLPFG